MVLVTGTIALLIIGILASTQTFHFMSAAHAACLSYGMYAGAVLLLTIEIVKIVSNCIKHKKETDPHKANQSTQQASKNSEPTKRTQGKFRFEQRAQEEHLEVAKKISDTFVNESIKQFTVHSLLTGNHQYRCEIKFNNGDFATVALDPDEIAIPHSTKRK